MFYQEISHNNNRQKCFNNKHFATYRICEVMRGTRGGGGGAGCSDLPIPEKTQNKGCLSDTGSDLRKIHKATKPEFNVGPSSARQ